MATGKSGNFTLTGTQNMKAKVYWSETYDTSANTSVVTVDVKVICAGSGGGYRYYLNGSISVNGKAVVSMSSVQGTHNCYAVYNTEADINAASPYDPPPWSSGDIAHSSDGSKSVAIAVNFSGYTKDGSGASGFSISGSSTVALTTIARASSITSAAKTTLGNKCSVKWTPLSTSFRYKLKFSLGDWSYTTGAIAPGTTSAYTYTGYTIPLTVANYIDEAKKTETMTVALYTYSDSACTNRIGSVSTKTFMVTIPDNSSTKPSVSVTGVPVSSLSSTFSDLFIQGLSKFQATITASGKYGASIFSKKLILQGKSYGSPYLSGFISASGEVTVKAGATDSRGFYNEVQKDITVIPYNKPSILPASGYSGIVCARCDASGELTESGTYLRIIAKRSYSKVMVDDVQKNFCEIRYRYRTESNKSFSDWVTLLSKSDISSNTIDSGAIAEVVPSTQISYVVQVGVADDIGEADAVQFNIPTDFVTIDCPESYKGRRMGLFRYVDGTDEDGLYVGLPVFGGSVDSLKLGTKLTATEDAQLSLNDIKTPGCYYSPTISNSQYITDSPYTAGGFGLEVREIQNKNYVRQTLYYARTVWMRHWNSETWSDWLRFLLTSQSGSTAEDFVVEQGASNGWRYKKWKSGNYQMYGYFTVTTTVAGTAYGSMYYSEQFALPTPFSIYSAVVSGSALSWFIVISGGKASTDPDNNVAFRLFRPTSFEAGQSITVRLNVVGTLN